MQVLVKVLPDDRVRIHTNAHLLQESINVGVQSLLASFLHDDQGVASVLDVVSNVLKLVARER